MFVLFLYSRVHRAAELQLDAAQNHDLDSLEHHGREREEATRLLWATLEARRQSGAGAPSTEVQNRVHQIVTDTLDVDSQIRDVLITDLSRRADELRSRISRTRVRE